MIKTTITYTKDSITSISISDHAMFAENEKDIVCASVSTLAFYTINALKMFEKDHYVETKVDVDNVTISFKVCEIEKTSQKFLKLLVGQLKEIATQYKKNIKIQEK